MSDETVRPEDVLADGLRQALIDAMIDAYMARGAIDEGATNLEFREKDGSDWVYALPVRGAGDPDVVCDSGGNWRQRKRGWFDKDLSPGEDTVDAGDNSYGVTIFDANAKWAEIEEFVADWVDPWVGTSPSPTHFTNQVNSIATVAKQLYVGAAPTGTDTAAPASADVDLWDALTEVGISADNTSASVDVFQRNYATDIWKTIGGQQGMVYAAGVAISAEAVAWHETYKSLRDFLNVAVHDFNSYAGSGEGRGEGVAAFLGATASVAGLLGATVGKALPPVGLVMGVVAGGASVARILNPAVPPVADESLVLEGGTYQDKVASFQEQIRAIEADLNASERSIVDACRAMVTNSQEFPDNYSLTRTPKKQGDYENFGAMLDSTIDISPNKLRKVAGACELIANHQLGLAAILGGNDAQGNASASVQDEWYRSGTLPGVGSIGYTAYGPYYAFTHLVDQTVDLLVDEGKNSHRVAEWLIEMVLGMEATDAQRERELAKLEGAIDDFELARGNDPTHPVSVTEDV